MMMGKHGTEIYGSFDFTSHRFWHIFSINDGTPQRRKTDMVHAIDTLGFAKRLRESGIPEDKAEALAFAIREFIVPVGTIEAPKLSGKPPEQLATKTDVAGLTARLIAILRKNSPN